MMSSVVDNRIVFLLDIVVSLACDIDLLTSHRLGHFVFYLFKYLILFKFILASHMFSCEY